MDKTEIILRKSIGLLFFSLSISMTAFGIDLPPQPQGSTMANQLIYIVKIAGETWSKGVYKGNPIFITWDKQSTHNVFIYLKQAGEKLNWDIALNIPNTGRYEWKVADEIAQNALNLEPPYRYRLFN